MQMRAGRGAAELLDGRRRILAGRGLALLLVVLGSLDVVSTNAATAAGFPEGNPIMRLAQDSLGTWWAMPKVLGHLGLAGLLLWLPSPKLVAGAGLVCAVYLGIVAHNFALAGWSI